MATLCMDAITASSRSASSEPISPDLPPCSSCSPPIHLLSPHNQEEKAKNPSARGRKEGKEDEGDALTVRRRTRRSSLPVRRRALAFARRRTCLRPLSPRAPPGPRLSSSRAAPPGALELSSRAASPGLVPGPLRSGSIQARNGLEWPVFIQDWA